MLLLVLVIAVLVVFVIQFQQFEHLLYRGLKSSAQVLAAVGLSKWRHMDEGRVALPKVKRGVVGVVTQIPAQEECQVKYSLYYHTSTWPNRRES